MKKRAINTVLLGTALSIGCAYAMPVYVGVNAGLNNTPTVGVSSKLSKGDNLLGLESSFHTKNNFYKGVVLGYKQNDYLSYEAEISQAKSILKTVETLGNVEDTGGSVEDTAYMANIKLSYKTDTMVDPYLKVGAGRARVSFGDDAKDTVNAVQAGVGANLKLTENINFGVGYNYRVTSKVKFSNENIYAGVVEGVNADSTTRVKHKQLGLSLTYSFA